MTADIKTQESNCYIPIWEKQTHVESEVATCFGEKNTWLIFANESEICLKTSELLESRSQKIIYIKAGTNFEESTYTNKRHIYLDPFNESSYNKLSNLLMENKIFPKFILFFWAYLDDSFDFNINDIKKIQYLGLCSVFFFNKIISPDIFRDVYFVSFSKKQFSIKKNDTRNDIFINTNILFCCCNSIYNFNVI